eukprot:6196128-Pleurochrysis_carterae.AAC.1
MRFAVDGGGGGSGVGVGGGFVKVVIDDGAEDELPRGKRLDLARELTHNRRTARSIREERQSR